MANTVINRPTLNGSNIPFPSSAEYEPILIASEHTTLKGKTRRDVMARKYRYELAWDYINVADYDLIEGIINTSHDNLTTINFVYEKWPHSEAPVEVLATLSGRELKYGTGKTAYLSSVKLVLTEVNPR